jgi:hypothetical protein
MAMHYWNGSAWKIVNNSWDTFQYQETNPIFNIWNGSIWTPATNAKVWNGSTWKGFIDQVQLSDDIAQNPGTGFGGSEAEWAIYSGGLVIFTNGLEYPWIVNPANSGQYQIMVSQTSGDPIEGTSSPLNTWLDLDTTRVWRVFANEFMRTTAFMVAEIRHKITQVTVATNNFVLDADTSGIPSPF